MDEGGSAGGSSPASGFSSGRTRSNDIVVAQRGPRGRGGGSSNATPGQQARLSAAEARASELLKRVRQIDSNFKPSASATARDSVEGNIARQESHAREAEVRLNEIRAGIHQTTSPKPTSHGNIRTGERAVTNKETSDAIITARQSGNVYLKPGKYGTSQIHYRGSSGLTVIVETSGRNTGKVITTYRNKD